MSLTESIVEDAALTWFAELGYSCLGAEALTPALLPRGHYRGGFDFAGLKEKARELRRKQTPAEELLWELLRDRRLAGAKEDAVKTVLAQAELLCAEWA